MKINKVRYILLPVAAVVMLSAATSCDDLFREKPNDKLSEEVIWSSELLLDEYTMSWYRNMDNGFSTFVTTLMKGLGREYEPWYTDQLTVSRSDWYQGDYGDILKSSQQEITNRGRSMWLKYYTQIRSINRLLENEGEIPDGAHKNRILGEAHFFRAYYYYLLLRMYGGPLLLKRTYEPIDEPETKFPRASFEETVNFIVEEANLAATYLDNKTTSDNAGRPCKGTCYVLAGKAYFWASGAHFQNVDEATPWLGFSDNRIEAMLRAAEREYDKARDLNIYSLMPVKGTTKDEIVAGYREIFLTKNSCESIWEVQHADDGDFSTKNGHKLDRESASPYFGGTTCAYVPTQNNVDEYFTINGKSIKEDASYDANNPYDNRDYRFYANVLYDGAMWNGHVMDIHYTRQDGVDIAGEDLQVYGSSTTACVTRTGYYLAKFRRETQKIDNDDTYASSQNCIIWRWAEILLDYAEIYYQTGREGEAMAMLNAIRERVHMPLYTSVTFEQIKQERRVELAFEKSIYWDLLRYNDAERAMTGRTNPLYGVKIVKNEDGTVSRQQVVVNGRNTVVRYFRARQYYWPIAWDDVRYHGVEQNPEWLEM